MGIMSLKEITSEEKYELYNLPSRLEQRIRLKSHSQSAVPTEPHVPETKRGNDNRSLAQLNIWQACYEDKREERYKKD